MTTTIRQAGPDDAATLAQIGAEAFTTAYAADLPLERLAAFAAETFAEARVAADLAEQPGCYLLLEVEGEAAGLAQLRDGPPPRGVTGPRPVELSKIYLLEKWIGRGLGTALMQASVDEARRRGYATLWLGVWERNPRAIAFYHKWGFVEAGDVAFRFGGEIQRDLIMVRAL